MRGSVRDIRRDIETLLQQKAGPLSTAWWVSRWSTSSRSIWSCARGSGARGTCRVIGRVGHDDFIFDMLKAAGNEKITIIRPTAAVPLMRAAHGGGVNSHTFISFTNAIQQTYAIAQALSTLRPALAPVFQQNAADYAHRLRAIKARAARELADAKVTRVVTVHDGYAYLMQEFGIEIAGVVEPAHGLTPSAVELEGMVDLIKRERIRSCSARRASRSRY
jgi:ABC-type Zn uptake system ZnuABC Zn-binding protein ZnuA